jgi:hypothetical protein
LGHFEKVLAWPWVLLGLGFLFDESRSPLRRGAAAGGCLGVIALTGANYYAFYAGVLFGALGLCLSWRFLLGLLGGSLVGLLHLPSVLYLIGEPRGSVAESIPLYRVTAAEAVHYMFLGMPGAEARFESYAMIGLPAVALLIVYGLRPLFGGRGASSDRRSSIALLFGLGIFCLLATGALYRGHHLLDNLRVPSRAMAFVAITLLLLIFVGGP